MKNMTKFTAISLAAAFGFAVAVSADDMKTAAPTLPPVATKTGVAYTTDIKPIFDAACVKCHDGTKKPVSYTHLDVYKRQALPRPRCFLPVRRTDAKIKTEGNPSDRRI